MKKVLSAERRKKQLVGSRHLLCAAELEIPEETVIYIVMSYPKPYNDFFMKYANCTIPFTYAYGINRLLLTDTLEERKY